MHLPHRPGYAKQQGGAILFQVRAHRLIGGRQVRGCSADHGQVIIMHPADIHRRRPFVRWRQNQVEDTTIRQTPKDLLAQFGVAPQYDDIVVLPCTIITVEHLDPVSLCPCPHPFGKACVGHTEYDLARLPTLGQSQLCTGAIANQPNYAAGLPLCAVFDGIRRFDARPRLAERHLSISSSRLDGQQVVAVIAIQHTLIDDIVTLKSTCDLVAIGITYAVDVDVRLHDEAVARHILAAQVFTDFDDRQGDLVAKYHRLLCHVTIDARVFFAGADHLDIRKADTDCVVAYKQFIRTWAAHRRINRATLHSQILPPRAEERPEAIGFRRLGYRRRDTPEL